MGIGAQLQLLEACFLAQGHQFKDVFIIGIAVCADDHGRLHATAAVSLLLGGPFRVGVVLMQIESLFADGAEWPRLADDLQLAACLHVQDKDLGLGSVHGASRLRDGQLDVFAQLRADEVHGDHEEHDQLKDQVEQRHQVRFRLGFLTERMAHG